MVKGVIDVQSLGLAKLYMTFDEQKKYESCKLVIEQALKSMSIPASREERKKYMDAILTNSIHYYEDEELYENCIILVDIKEVLSQLP